MTDFRIAFKSIFLSVLLLTGWAFQVYADKSGYFRITFSDKAHSSYTLDEPGAFLSERALERREINGILTDSTDLPVSPAYIDSIRHAGGQVRFSSKWFNYTIAGIADDEIYDRIEGFDFVIDLTLVKPFLEDDNDVDSIPEQGHPKMPLSAPSVYGVSGYGDSELQISQVSGQFLHERGYRGDGIMIAVLDAGFPGVDSFAAFTHLINNDRIAGNYDFIRGEAGVYAEHSHGSSVLSVMAGMLEGKLRGTAAEASYLLLRSEDVRSEYRIEEHAWIAAAEYADSAGADIINSSLGYTVFDDTSMSYSRDDLDGTTTWVARGANKAYEKGIIVINSAGNYGDHWWETLVSPGDAHGVITVGGLDHDKNRINFSSLGYTADGRIKPSVMAMGYQVTIASATRDGEISAANGTSFASPIIAGLTAALREAFPEKTHTEITEAIINSTHLRTNPNREMGYGIPDFRRAYQDLAGQAVFAIEKIYPNPFYDRITIQLYSSGDQKMSLALYDVKGRKISGQKVQLQANRQRELIIEDLSDLGPGLFFLHLRAGENTEKVKLFKP